MEVLYGVWVEIRLVSGRLLDKLTVKDYSITSILESRTCTTLCMCKYRFKLLYQGDEICYNRSMFQLLKGNRLGQITCVVLPPENLTCEAAVVRSGWNNLLTGLPEYHKKMPVCRLHIQRVWVEDKEIMDTNGSSLA